MRFLVGLLTALILTTTASAQIRITEWMYSGPDGEFIEFTNIGVSAIDMSGWSYDDDSQVPGTVDLSAFGVVQPGESVILTEADATSFSAAWNLAASVKVIGDLTTNLGRNDEINLYDENSILIDRLTYGDQAFPGSIRTQNTSGWTQTGLGLNDPYLWQFSVAGDEQNSYFSAGGALGSPGFFRAAAVPEPTTLLLGGLGLGATVLGASRYRTRRRGKSNEVRKRK